MAGDTSEGCQSNTAPETPRQESLEMSTKEMNSKGIDSQKEEKIRDLQALHGKATQELDALLRKCIKEVEGGCELPEAHKRSFNQMVMPFKAATSRVIRPSEAEEESLVGTPVTDSDSDAAVFSKDEPMAKAKEESPFQATMGHATPSPKPNSGFKSFPWLSKGGRGPVPAPFSPGVRQVRELVTSPS
ncbi:unnamed protein product [Clonostachys solani]|uniref:Uncharacterized protein n=1 Tax=Clonostachys solani TaxID=160281 RepID=A0A9N9VWE9_9HYPO|nr:unnamed protein product [Clonostachys solani]